MAENCAIKLEDIEHLPILETEDFPHKPIKAVERAEIGLFQQMGEIINTGEVFDKTYYVAGRYQFKSGWVVVGAEERHRKTGTILGTNLIDIARIRDYTPTEYG